MSSGFSTGCWAGINMCDEFREIIRQHSRPIEPKPTGREAVLRTLEGVKAVLFDVYGTLFISASGEVGSAQAPSRAGDYQQAFHAVGVDIEHDDDNLPVRLDETIKSFHQQSRDAGVEYPEVDIVEVWRAQSATGPLDDLALRRLALHYEVRTNPVWPMPNCRACLAELSGLGMRLGIISNAQFYTPELFGALLDADLESLGVHPELVFYSYLYRQAKPGFFLFERAKEGLAGLGLAAHEALYVGNDMLNDIYAASKCGFRTALFAGDARSLREREGDPRMEGIEPDLVLTDLGQLSGCLIAH